MLHILLNKCKEFQEVAGCVDTSMARKHLLLSLNQDEDWWKTLFKRHLESGNGKY